MHTRHEIRVSTRTQVATRAHNTTQRVHNSNGALIAIARNQMRGIEVLVLRNAWRMLGVLLHAPRGPFYSPRQLGAVESIPRRQILPSVAWRTGQSGADLLPYLAKPTVGAWEPLAHRTLSGAHRTVRCPIRPLALATRRARIPRPTVGPADSWLTRQSGAHRTVR
jgi:hypothetical protein